MIASRTAKATSAAFVALVTTALLGTALVTGTSAPLGSHADGSTWTVATSFAGSSPTDVTWGG